MAYFLWIFIHMPLLIGLGFLTYGIGVRTGLITDLPIKDWEGEATFLILFGIPFHFAFKSLLTSLFQQKRLIKSGIDGQARILGLRNTGTYINESPLVEMDLEILNPVNGQNRAKCSTVISLIDLPQFQPGTLVRIKMSKEKSSFEVMVMGILKKGA